MGRDGQFHAIRGILDSGNDVTLLTPGATQELGISQMEGNGTFNVKGIGAKPMVFNNVRLLMRVKGTQPVWIRAGAQIPQPGDDNLRDNLFGRKDLLDNFDIYMSKGTIELHQTRNAGGANSIGMSMPYQPNDARWKYKSDIDDGCPFSNC
jgi:hypothetical protein